MLNYREKDGSAQHAEDEEGREPRVVLEEIGEVVVVEEDEDEGDGRNEEDEDHGVEQRAFELLGCAIGRALEVDEGGRGADRGGGGEGGRGERVD